MRKILKPVRVAVSLLVFAIFCGIFADVAVMSCSWAATAVTDLQFVPSVIHFFHCVSWSGTGFLLIILLTLLFGRIYCSSLCPLGTIQDIANGIRTRLSSKGSGILHGMSYRRPILWVSYPLLGLTLISVLAGNLFLVSLLDPFSIAGRSFSGAIAALITLPGNPLINLPDFISTRGVYPGIHPIVTRTPWLVIIAMFLFIITLSVWKGRWYCTVICPAGILLGTLSRVSLLRIRLDPKICRSCGTCLDGCKSGCISSGEKRIDFSRCVTCFNCLRTCPEGALSYAGRIGKSGDGRKQKTISQYGEDEWRTRDYSRREFFRTVIGAVPALAVSIGIRANGPDGRSGTVSPGPGPYSGKDNPFPAIPPGSVSVKHYTERCTSCYLCISNCPAGVLQPSLLEFGLTGILQPRMDFESGFCRYECKKCLDICPTGAILPLQLDQKQRIRTGMARFIKNLCVPVADRTRCSRCSDLCPVKAVIMKPYLGDLTLPVIDESLCNGCGACEYICPARPVRAIYVEPLAVHTIAWKPEATTGLSPSIPLR